MNWDAFRDNLLGPLELPPSGVIFYFSHLSELHDNDPEAAEILVFTLQEVAEYWAEQGYVIKTVYSWPEDLELPTSFAPA